MAKILIASSDSIAGCRLKRWLEESGHNVELTSEAAETISRLRFYQYDLLVLGHRLADADGVGVCQTLRGSGEKIPILAFVEAADGNAMERSLLLAGADDCMIAPLIERETNARIEALLLRPPGADPARIVFRHIVLDCASREVFCEGRAVELSSGEHVLIELLLRSPGKLITIHALRNAFADRRYEVSEMAIRISVSRLRKKLDKLGQPSIIRTCNGRGYMLAGESSARTDENEMANSEQTVGGGAKLILLVSSDAQFASRVEQASACNSCSLRMVPCPVEGQQLADASIIVIDASATPDESRKLCQDLRDRDVQVPVLMAGRFLDRNDEVQFLDAAISAGGDGVVSVHDDVELLALRIAAALRRPKTYCGKKMLHGDIALDVQQGKLLTEHETLPLSPMETTILALLMRHPCQVFSADDIIDRLYANGAAVSQTAVRIHISRIRHKIRALRARTTIRTQHGIGYRLQTA